MKKFVSILLLATLLMVSVVSCGGSNNSAKKIKGTYVLTDKSWEKVVNFYNENPKCKENTYASPYYEVREAYEEGKDNYLENGIKLTIKDDKKITIVNDSMVVNLDYELLDTDIVVDIVALYKQLYGYTDEALKKEGVDSSVKFKIGTFEDNYSCIHISNELDEFMYLYKK